MIQAAAYWGPGDGPTGDDAIEALVATCELIGRLSGITTWYRTGEKPTRPVTRDDLPAVLAEGVHRDDDAPPKVMDGLGRHINLWDGDEGDTEWSAAVEGTAATWCGSAVLEHPGLPSNAGDAWPLLAELIQIWRPETASWTTHRVRMSGIRAGLNAAQPHLGLLTWVRDGIEAPFTGGDTLRTNGGTLYRFGDDIADITAETAQRVIRAT